MANVTIYHRIDQEELDELVHQLRNLTRQREDLEAEIDGIKDLLKEAMGTEETLLGPDYRISYKRVTRSSIDPKALLRNFPDVYRACTRETTFRRFEVR